MPSSARRDCAHPRARHRHGTPLAYTADRCRCFACRIAYSEAQRTNRYGDPASWIDRTGTIRRLQALHVIGWSDAAIAARLGVTKQAVSDLGRRDRMPILAATAARIADVYDTLWGQIPPSSPAVSRTRNRAAGRGWLPPLAWDDDTIDNPTAAPQTPREARGLVDPIAVDQAIGGRRVHLTKAERVAAVRELDARDYTAHQIAERLGVSQRTIVRKRAVA